MILFVTLVIAHKIVAIGGFEASAGTFTFPLYYFCSDVVTEVYGYRIAKQIVWSAVACQILFVLITNLFLELPSPVFWHLGGAYHHVFFPLLRQVAAATIALFVSSLINVYFVSRWKVLTRGKYFWLRSIGSSTLGELIFNMILFFGTFYAVYPIGKILILIIVAYFFKAIISIVLSYPGNILTDFLKEKEGVDAYDHHASFKL